MGANGSLIAAVVVTVIIFIAVLVFAILDWLGLIAKWTGKKIGPTGTRYVCLTSAECGSIYGLSPSYVCDPKLKQCRIRAYEPRSCNANTDCLQITPLCATPVSGAGRMCTHDPYNQLGLYGDPTQIPHCLAGLSPSSFWGFCQLDLNNPCKSTDECVQGACVGSRCQFLGPFDVCTESSSYGHQQCQIGLYCAQDLRHPLATTHCQRNGIAPGATGAYCGTNSDCHDGDCYRANPADPYGVCASHQALVGMSCTLDADCAQSLTCQIPSGQTSGTCVFRDPAQQSDKANCPPQYTELPKNGGGCVGAIFPVPCTQSSTCQTSGGCGLNVGSLVLASLNPDQTWNPLYPTRGQDFLGIFTAGFTGGAGMPITIRPNVTILVSPSQLEGESFETYPTINLKTPKPPPTIPVVPQQPRACQPLLRGTELASLFSNNTQTNILFDVTYNPTNVASSTVQVVYLRSGNQPTSITVADPDLYASFYQDKNPYDPSAGNPTQIYVNCNYHGRAVAKAFNFSPETKPTYWAQPSVTDIWLIPPPLLPPNLNNQNYLDNCLRFAQDDPAHPEPTIFVHFFYHPKSNERVISWRFQVLPMQTGGGVNVLVGLYEVQIPAGRRLVVSTMSIYVQNPGEAETTAQFSYNNGPNDIRTIYAYRVPLTIDARGMGVYASVYSFALIDFATNWPFTLQLPGPAPTWSDTGGLCNVIFADSLHGTATVDQLAPHPEAIPKFAGYYPVFTPRSYTRVQAATPIRNDKWTSPNLFGDTNPSLLDSDIVVLATAGASSIVGFLLTYSVVPVGGNTYPPQTLMITMRFGDCMPTSRYSIPNLIDAGLANHTLMYAFFLTPEPEETGGGDLVGSLPVTTTFKYAFNAPQVELTPVTTNDISSWATQPFIGPYGTPLADGLGQYVAHQMRTSWGSEVFTACLVPSRLIPPVRFFRMPAGSGESLSTKGADDVWIWGRDFDDRTAIRCVPVFFDNLGLVKSSFTNKPQPSNLWVSTAATTCPPTASQVTVGQDHVYFLTTGDTYHFAQGNEWNISPVAILTYNSDVGPLQLTGRMCQTQGYQDGLLYRARPYIFAATNDQDNLPFAISQILNGPTNLISIVDLESTALALSSYNSTDAQNQDYQASLSLIGIGSITTLIGSQGSLHPLIPGLFLDDAQIVWVGSESQAPILPGGYRTLACPANPKANPITIDSSYPTDCPDYPLTQSVADRKPLPICIIYQRNSASQLEMRLYDIRMIGGTATLISDTLIQTNGALTHMALPYSNQAPSGSWGGYPGFNGGPAVIYTPCLS